MANGNFAGGTGVADDPYLIEDAFDLDAVRNNLSAHYKLINDIDLNISPFNEGEGWVPIGDNSTNNISTRFRGVLDGDGHVVKNLYINRPSASHQGLFGYIYEATISNVGVEDVDVTGGDYTGGLVGQNSSSSVINSYSTGSVTGSGIRTGGLVGTNSNSTVTNSYSTGSVSGGNETGGLVGYNYYNSTVTNSYSTGSVSGSGSYTGGLVGRNYDSSTIDNSYSTGSVTGGKYTGGLVGQNSSSTVTDSFWNTETSGMSTSAGGTGLTTQEMQIAQTFIDAGWDTKIWSILDGKYPDFDFTVRKILILSSFGDVLSIEEGGSHDRIKKLPSSTEQDFLNHGMNTSTVIDPRAEITQKQYINNQSTPLGSGKVFEQPISGVVKKITIE